MEKARFCHVIDAANFNPLLYNSIKYSDRSKIEYTVICLGPTGPLQQQMEDLGVRFISFKNNSRKRAISNWWKLFRFFRKEKTRIVQTHLFDSSLIGLLAAKFAGVPVRIFTRHHSHEVPLHKRKLLTFVDGISGHWLANHTIAPSMDMKEILIHSQKVPIQKIEVIPHGFDLEYWRQTAGLATGIKKELQIEDKIVFGATGRLFWVKDFETLIEAFTDFSSNRDDVVLLIVDGDDKEKLQQLVSSKGMTKKIILTGRRTDIAVVMNCFDVFVHSSIAESFGMVYIEAFALGKPVISTRVGIAPDIIRNGENGLLVATKNAGKLTAAMEKMMARQQDWKQMGMENKKIAENYAVQKTQALCDRFYLKWLDKK
ncbi:MAG: glycosyltransferase [Chitinophagaceae bacterium]|nr:glycosyltransferase [Chitinophagaceae bacterium]